MLIFTHFYWSNLLQDENVAKLNKEKKHQEEVNRKLLEDLQAEEVWKILFV